MEVHSPALQIGCIPCYLTPSADFDDLGGPNACDTMSEPVVFYLTRGQSTFVGRDLRLEVKRVESA
jgi:hypothetical protein